MSRPRLWDEAGVLDGAMAVFRAKGFERTALRDLETATGIRNGSLYKAYSSKAGLFGAVLSVYNDRVVRGRIAFHLLQADDPIAGLQAFFASTYEGRTMPDPGCLLTNSAIEAPALDDDARLAIASGLGAIREAFVEVLERAQEQGVIGSTEPITLLAERLLALYQGLLVLVRFDSPIDELAAIPGAIPALVGHSMSGARK